MISICNQKSDIAQLDAEKLRDVQQKSGHMWKCIDRTETGHGYIYEFKLRKKFDYITPKEQLPAYYRAVELNNSLFPAVEQYGLSLLYLDPDVSFKEILKLETFLKNVKQFTSITLESFAIMRKNGEFQRSLGYGCQKREGSIALFLPDKAHLISQWREEPLEILESSGIASDRAFIESFFNHDAVLSQDKEFVHDHTLHLMKMFAKIDNVGMSTYRSEKAIIVNAVQSAYQMIQESRLLAVNVQPYVINGGLIEHCRCEIVKDKESGFYIDSVSDEKMWNIFETSLSAFIDSLTSYDQHAELLNDINKDKQHALLLRFNGMWLNKKGDWFAYLESRYGKLQGWVLNKSWKYLVSDKVSS